MDEEPAAEGFDGRLDAVAQMVERARALLVRLARPLFEPALLGFGGLDARGVADEPEQQEVGVDLAFHHGLEVELDIGLAGEAGVVAQDAQAQAVGDEAPEAVFAAVQELLHQAVRAAARRAGHTRREPVEIHAASHEMRRDARRGMRDGVRLALDLDGRGTRQASVAELLKQRQQPALAGCDRAGVVSGQLLYFGPEAGPQPGEAAPGAACGLAQALAGRESVVRGLQSFEPRAWVADALEQIVRQDGALRADGGEDVLGSSLHGLKRPEGRRMRRRRRREAGAARARSPRQALRPSGRGRGLRAALRLCV